MQIQKSMKISLNWLRNYLALEQPVENISKILTDIGLEVEGIETFESIKGGLEGVVIGEVMEVKPHPNADRLLLTKVDVGHADLLPIVCGAPNVKVGQKVPVALVGTTLYPDEKGFKIKKAKIRGEVSEGMICAEDELGLGTDHDGIMVLDENLKVGTLAADYFETKKDTVFEIGLTPNRIDAASHYGVARDLAAFLRLSEEVQLIQPALDSLKDKNNSFSIEVEVKDHELCPRYSGITLQNIKVESSPEWLKNALNAIGVKPINNVVDITNYVLHEIGQPLHAFDAAKIKDRKIIVQTLKEATPFTTLDQKERSLSSTDLMICNQEAPMCIAGVLGGADSGVTEATTSIFLESAYFNPVAIRKTAKRHGLNTDASFRYERGTDPDITVFALKRAVYLLRKFAGAELSSDLIDIYPNPSEEVILSLRFEDVDRLIGQKISPSVICTILEGLEIKILHQSKTEMRLQIPAYRVDVNRPADVIEEILRIYGYNNIQVPQQIKSSLNYSHQPTNHKIEQSLADFLSSKGFVEILNNSLTNPGFYDQKEDLVKMLNPLSNETEVLRKSMLFGGLQAIAYNRNRKQDRLKFYEFGKTYRLRSERKYAERKQLAIWLSGYHRPESWFQEQEEVSFYHLKAIVESILSRLGVKAEAEEWLPLTESEESKDELFSSGIKLLKNKKELLSLGRLSEKVGEKLKLDTEVFYAEMDWDALLKIAKRKEIRYKTVPKFPSVRRDLALLLDQDVAYSRLEAIAVKVEQHLLKKVNLFDVYQGEKLPKGKKSYCISFIFQDAKNTLTDEKINRIMDRLIKAYSREVNAELR